MAGNPRKVGEKSKLTALQQSYQNALAINAKVGLIKSQKKPEFTDSHGHTRTIPSWLSIQPTRDELERILQLHEPMALISIRGAAPPQELSRKTDKFTQNLNFFLGSYPANSNTPSPGESIANIGLDILAKEKTGGLPVMELPPEPDFDWKDVITYVGEKTLQEGLSRDGFLSSDIPTLPGIDILFVDGTKEAPIREKSTVELYNNCQKTGHVLLDFDAYWTFQFQVQLDQILKGEKRSIIFDEDSCTTLGMYYKPSNEVIFSGWHPYFGPSLGFSSPEKAASTRRAVRLSLKN